MVCAQSRPVHCVEGAGFAEPRQPAWGHASAPGCYNHSPGAEGTLPCVQKMGGWVQVLWPSPGFEDTVLFFVSVCFRRPLKTALSAVVTNQPPSINLQRLLFAHQHQLITPHNSHFPSTSTQNGPQRVFILLLKTALGRPGFLKSLGLQCMLVDLWTQKDLEPRVRTLNGLGVKKNA